MVQGPSIAALGSEDLVGPLRQLSLVRHWRATKGLPFRDCMCRSINLLAGGDKVVQGAGGEHVDWLKGVVVGGEGVVVGEGSGFRWTPGPRNPAVAVDAVPRAMHGSAPKGEGQMVKVGGHVYPLSRPPVRERPTWRWIRARCDRPPRCW